MVIKQTQFARPFLILGCGARHLERMKSRGGVGCCGYGGGGEGGVGGGEGG